MSKTKRLKQILSITVALLVAVVGVLDAIIDIHTSIIKKDET